ncbi:hypothetical protein HDU96_008163 [Phlyctochytrium bullatum]|nr:hypothetical protein HDU96_008163 [Phlyctochytrium bullatum]
MANTSASTAAAQASIQDDQRYERTIQILRAYFQSNDDDARPEEGPFEGWTNRNKFYFLKGILTYAETVNYTLNGTTERRDRTFYVDEFARVFGTVLATLNTDSRVLEEKRYIQDLYNRFIQPFKPDAGNETPPQMSESSSGDDSPSHHQIFSKNVLCRDRVCLCCWDDLIEAVHLVQPEPRNGAGYSQNLLTTAGIDAYEVHNGVLLCWKCRDMFYGLKLYIDTDTDNRNRFLCKFVPVSTAERPWYKSIIYCKGTRKSNQDFELSSNTIPKVDWSQRHIEDASGELAVYFARKSEPQDYPNQMALRFHKSACLMWRMAIDCVEDPELPPRAD